MPPSFLSFRPFVLPLALAVLAFALGAAPSARAQAPGGQAFASAPLEIVTAEGRHAFTVEIAATDAQRAQGLMFRRFLAPDAGMLFLYPSPRVISMWMKNTLIPLDMLFLDAGGRVLTIHQRAVPGSERTVSSRVPAAAVLEVPGGTVERLGIRPGDRVENSFLGGGR